jgi:large subunit ribosomal protein L18
MRTQKQRRRQHKTDYLKRLKLLKSGKPRLIFRRTNKYIIVQYIKSEEARDKIIFGVNSKNLLKYGWPEKCKGSLKSITASYLIGYLAGRQVKTKKLEKPIIDFGMLKMIQKGKQHAFIKGVVDSGISINCPEEAFPDEKRIKGEHMKNKISFDEIKLKIDKS